ncbi:4-hydroxy-3-methylbut-2-enyl diphosphate reductase [Patescibacteria group bacterium]
MKVNVAKHAGFCAGVKIAVRKALTAAAKPGEVYMLGDIVHNEIVVNQLDDVGAKVVDKIFRIPKGATILVRAHGTVPRTYEQARRRGLKIIDATCPMVADIHQEARRLAKKNYQVAIVGDEGHDEVIGIAGQVAKSIILAEPADVEKKLPQRIKKLGVVVQSTQSIDKVKDIISALVNRVEKLVFVDTICRPTKKRQSEARELARQNDVVIVIGSPSSANTKRLVEICQQTNSRTHRVMTSKNLRSGWLKGVKTVGITAGASTPREMIDKVVEKLEKCK